MNWSSSEIEYEGFPLLLRRPDHPDIWSLKDTFTQLVRVEHMLDKVSKNGLPEKIYNQSLADFDHHMCGLLENTGLGIIFLTETFAGIRNYYYYTLPGFNIDYLIENAKNNFKVNLKFTVKTDNGWRFLIIYPVQLYHR